MSRASPSRLSKFSMLDSTLTGLNSCLKQNSVKREERKKGEVQGNEETSSKFEFEFWIGRRFDCCSSLQKSEKKKIKSRVKKISVEYRLSHIRPAVACLRRPRGRRQERKDGLIEEILLYFLYPL